jgi:MFS family permease
MKRIAALFASLVFVAVIGAPVALAADESLPHTDRVLMAFNGDIAVPAGEHADVVFVVRGDADIAGTVNTVTVIDGTATIQGATVENIVVISGSVVLEDGSRVLGNVRAIESTVTQAADVTVAGDVKGLDAELIALGAFLGPAMLLFAIGLFLASLAAGLLLAAVGARQVRATERLIATEPLKAFGVGLLGAICIPILAIVAIVTVVGAPLGLGILLGLLPLLAFVGFLVAAIFVGEELLGTRKEPAAERPYRGALLGIFVLQALGIVPVVGGLVTGVASVFGFGAILLLAWRILRSGGTGETAAPQSAPMALGA